MSRIGDDSRSIRTRNRPPVQSDPQEVAAAISSSALPTGASTEAKQDTQQTTLDTIESVVATAAKQDTGNASLAAIDAALNALNAAVATAANQVTQQTTLDSIESLLSELVDNARGGFVPSEALPSFLTLGAG